MTQPERRFDPVSVGALSPDSLDNVVRVSDESDLPEVENGTHTLEGSTAYHFVGFPQLENPIELGFLSPLLSTHGGLGGFIYTGGTGAAIQGTDVPVFMRNMSVSAPGADLFDLSASNDQDWLIESCLFGDFASIGNFASLGRIEGYEVPTFINCSIQEFDGGLTFDSTSDKIFLTGCPVRGVTASGVDIFTLKGTASVEIVEMVDCYVKKLQSDTRVWHIEDGAEPSEVFQYRGNTHDPTVTKDNVITGPNASKDVEPFWVKSSHPLRPSAVIGDLVNDNQGTVTIDTQDTYIGVNIPSTLKTDNRISKVSDGVIQYDGVKDAILTLSFNVSFFGGNGDRYTFAIAKNGTVQQSQTSSVEARGQNANITVSVSGVSDLTTGDQLSLQVKNVDGTTDVDILGYSFNLMGE